MLISTDVSSLFDFLIKHTIAILTLTFAVVSLITYFHLNRLSDEQIRSTAIQNARLYSEFLNEFHSLYSSEVVITAKNNGLGITHDYAAKKNAIPLPATLSMMISNRLNSQGSAVTSKLYSPYPFPWRTATGGLSDSFSRDAWQALLARPSQPYYRFEVIDGHASLRYASADIMRESCVDCHNSHQDTAKADWKIGDISGVLEITTQIESNITSASWMIRQTLYLLISILALTLVGIGLVMRQLQEKTKQAQQLAASSSKTNKKLAQEVKVRQQTQEKLLKMSLTDSLTGIANRRKFDQEFSREWLRAQRKNTSLAVVLLDIDDFKSYNDNYGHQQGDMALRTIAKTMANRKQRASDLICRYGGEEFILLLPDTDIIGASQFAEELRSQIEACAINHDFARAANTITISAGVAAVVPNESIPPQSLIKAADDALYLAKDDGRNCVRQQALPAPLKIIEHKH